MKKIIITCQRKKKLKEKNFSTEINFFVVVNTPNNNNNNKYNNFGVN